MYLGTFDPEYWHQQINLLSAVSVEDAYGFKYVAIKTSERRASELESRFDKHDQVCTLEGNKIKLINLAGFQRIVSFEKGERAEKHVIWQTIEKFRGSPTYWQWSIVKGEHYELDVVKKRRLMQSAAEDDSSCPEALRRFEDFEAAVLPALMTVSRIYAKTRYEELLQMESDMISGSAMQPGVVYVAVSNALKYPKIGATRRVDPLMRLRELSGSVPSPFKPILFISTLTPFRTEADLHNHFDDFRIKEAGASTEFFRFDVDTIRAFVKKNYANVTDFRVDQ